MTTPEVLITMAVACFGLGLVLTIAWYELRVVPTLDGLIEHYRQSAIRQQARVSQLEHRGTPYRAETLADVRAAALLDLLQPDDHNASRRAPLEVVQ